MQIVVDEVLLHYEVVNSDKENVVLVLHGWGHDGDMWRKTVSQMSSQWRYVLLDMPGFGQSAHLPKVANVPDFAKLVENFISKMKIDGPVLLGHSFGGQVGLKMAIDSPTLLKKLLLLSPAGIRKRTIKQRMKVFVFSNFSNMKTFLPNALIERAIKYVSATDYSASSDEHREILKLITQYDLTDQLSEVQIPVKIYWGDRDEAISYMGKRMVELMDNAELYVLYDSSHNVHIENPTMLADRLDEGLEIR